MNNEFYTGQIVYYHNNNGNIPRLCKILFANDLTKIAYVDIVMPFGGKKLEYVPFDRLTEAQYSVENISMVYNIPLNVLEEMIVHEMFMNKIRLDENNS